MTFFHTQRATSFALITAALITPVTAPNKAHAGLEPLIGEIMLFAGTFCPRGWMLADGRVLNISEHQALFSILGATYGGDERKTFALPDLRGAVPQSPGQAREQLRYCIGYVGAYPARH